MMLVTSILICTLGLVGAQNEEKLKLPQSVIVSTTLDVGNSKNGTNSAHIVETEIEVSDSNIRDRRFENNKFYNFQKNKLKDLINAAPVHNDSPKINYYSMDCAAGHKCTALIPGTKTAMPSSAHRSKAEMKNYLRKHGLENGFNYSDDDRVNRHNVVARYFKGENDNMEKSRTARKGRRIGSKFYDYEDYWPGSEYRPKKANKVLPSKSKAKIYKYGIKSSNKNGIGINSWNHAPSSSFYNYDYPASLELPFPSFSNGNEGKVQYSNKFFNEGTNKGGWNRYSSSVIAQYDKDKKDWVKISSSNADLGSGFVNTQYKPSYQKGSSTKGPSVSLTVLGLPGIDNPYYANKPSRPIYDQTYKPFEQDQQNHFSQSPDHPFPPISNAPTKPSVSFPLNVLPLDLSFPSLVFTSEGININLSRTNVSSENTTSHSNTTHTSSSASLSSNSSALNASTTSKPELILRTTRRPILTQRTQSFSQDTQIQQASTNNAEGGDGNGGGGGGGVVTNAYAVMAAVGAGLIPASIAAILPVLLGRRKKRSLKTIWKGSPDLAQEALFSPSLQRILGGEYPPALSDWRRDPSTLTFRGASSPPDLFTKQLLRSTSHSKQIPR